MTEQEFLDVLTTLAGKPTWEARVERPCPSDSLIRLYQGGKCFCPVTAVCEAQTAVRYKPDAWRRAARDIQLDSGLAEDIVNAADGEIVDDQAKALRPKLLAACGQN